MPRLIKLLPGDRSTTDNAMSLVLNYFRVDLRSGETDKLNIDCERWLDGATISTATTTDSFLSLSLATPIVTVTITGSDALQRGSIIVTASDGRVRKVYLETRSPVQTQYQAYDYHGWY